MMIRSMAGLMAAVCMFVSGGYSAVAADNGLVTKPSQFSVGTTIDRLESALKAAGNTIFARVDHSAEAAKVGLKLRPTQLLIWGNPTGGTPLMAAAPTAAIDLPQKFLAWEDADGKTWLTYNSFGYLKQRHAIGGMDEALRTLQTRVDAIADKAHQ
jgi:YD repeat-containing protein